jgi:hypothetical protein
VELLVTFTFLMLAYFGPTLFQESSVEQPRVRVSPFKKQRGRKELRKNCQRNKPHVHLVKPETAICTHHILGINALLVLLVSFIYGFLARKSHERLGCMSTWDQDCKRRWSYELFQLITEKNRSKSTAKTL